jgi:Na+-translocating ferredoxin:NAD+ oxidoreductase subunit B
MLVEEKVYRDLQQHLDRQAIGFPATKSGVEIRILKRFFTPEEARLAMHMSYRPTTVEKILETFDPWAVELEDTKKMLESMSKKGAIGYVQKEGTDYYHTLPLLIGIYELQTDKLTPELLTEIREYFTTAFGRAFFPRVSQMRTIPVEKSIPVNHEAMTYDHIREIIDKTEGPIVVLKCICREGSRVSGGSCKKTHRLETCMALGEGAKRQMHVGAGRPISKAEAMEIMRQNEADGLVLQPSNMQKVEYVCSCCGCCCGVLRMHKMLPKPVDFWTVSYFAQIDAGKCSGCQTCVKRCQVNAIKVDEKTGISGVDLDRCIGCGNCVPTCPSGARFLVKREKGAVPPVDSEQLYEAIMTSKQVN